MILNNQIWIDKEKPVFHPSDAPAPGWCKRGHPLTEENQRINKRGWRHGCRICHNEDESMRGKLARRQKNNA